MHSKLFQIKCFNVFALVTINHSSPPHMMLSYRPSSSSSPPRHYQRHPQLASTNYTNYCNNLIGKIPFYYKVRESQVRLYNNFPQNTVFAWPEETMICSVGKSERGLSVLFDFVMALTSAAQLMFWVLQFFCSLWFCIFWESISRRIDAVLAPERRLIKILNEKGIILKAVNLFFTAP